jgi:hypothetical protein
MKYKGRPEAGGWRHDDPTSVRRPIESEIITWGLGEGEVAPLLPEITDPETLARLYRLLTARDPITPAAR